MNGASATPPRRHNDLPTSLATRPPASSSTMASSQASQPLSLEAMLSAHAGADNPAFSALEQSVSERNFLSSQNAQLWKLIEKSRGLYTESQKNLERVRMERDAYKAKLLSLGENPDAIARGHKEREKHLKPSASSNGMRQGSNKLSSQGSGSTRPSRHQSADTGTWPCIRARLSFRVAKFPMVRFGCRSTHSYTPVAAKLSSSSDRNGIALLARCPRCLDHTAGGTFAAHPSAAVDKIAQRIQGR
jgi:hypothetical protein